jgi:hypothetical protein
MRPERLRSLIKTALAEGAVQVEVVLKTGETVRVQFAQTEKTEPDLVEWKR